MGALFKAAAFAHPVRSGVPPGFREASPCCKPLRSAKLARIRHAFFTRAGGVSQGVYASLNGGVGSNDAPDKVAENRARMATALGVPPDRLLTAYQIHSPDVVVADKPWTRAKPPARRRHRHPHAAACHRRLDRRLRAAAVRRRRKRA